MLFLLFSHYFHMCLICHFSEGDNATNQLTDTKSQSNSLKLKWYSTAPPRASCSHTSYHTFIHDKFWVLQNIPDFLIFTTFRLVFFICLPSVLWLVFPFLLSSQIFYAILTLLTKLQHVDQPYLIKGVNFYYPASAFTVMISNVVVIYISFTLILYTMGYTI